MKIEPGRVSTEELLAAVADPLRRDLLNCLHGSDVETATVDELAEELPAADGVQGSFPAEGGKLRVRLQHVHLPKLAETGVLAFDPRSGTVRYAGDERVAKLLRFVAEELEPATADD